MHWSPDWFGSVWLDTLFSCWNWNVLKLSLFIVIVAEILSNNKHIQPKHYRIEEKSYFHSFLYVQQQRKTMIFFFIFVSVVIWYFASYRHCEFSVLNQTKPNRSLLFHNTHVKKHNKQNRNLFICVLVVHWTNCIPNWIHSKQTNRCSLDAFKPIMTDTKVDEKLRTVCFIIFLVFIRFLEIDSKIKF